MNLDIVIVTYNRIEKLKKTLFYYENQSQSFRNLIVVNNNSTDGSFEFLNKWKNEKSNYTKHVIHLSENLGGSGGFYEGQKYALSLFPDWIFIADDDAYADNKMIEDFYKFTQENDVSKFSAICTTVLNPDKSICYFHRSKIRINKLFQFNIKSSVAEDYQKEYFEIDLLSYVGSFLNIKSLHKCGLVNPDYFIYADDGEHSLRIKKYGKIICVPNIKITHDGGTTEDSLNNNFIVTWRDYYLTRNYLNMIIKNYPLAAIYQTLSIIKNKIFKNKHKTYKKIVFHAVCDAWKNKLGKHPIYKPGWSIRKV